MCAVVARRVSLLFNQHLHVQGQQCLVLLQHEHLLTPFACNRVTTDKAPGEGLHEFGALNTLLFVRAGLLATTSLLLLAHYACVLQVIILGLCIVCAYLIKEYRFYYLPESGAAMLVGLIVGVWYDCCIHSHTHDGLAN